GLTLKEIFSLKLFGSVSAQGGEVYCCEERKVNYGGGICIEVDDVNECNRSGNLHASPTNCSLTSYCRLGWCIDDSQGLCSPNSPRGKCEEMGGRWEENYDTQICQLGCCTLGNTKQYVSNPICN
ncbi:unnamed protein product, partial [marine sediment metagenome]